MKPFKKSKWLWYRLHNVDLVNSWMRARRSFTLNRIPAAAEIKITADAQYKLWVNGHYACRGPARGFQEKWPYDRVNIAGFLRKGLNVICVLVHNPGVSSFQYVHRGWAGLIVEGKIGGTDIASGENWKVSRAPGYERTLWQLSAQMPGMQEFFDTRKDDGAWRNAAFDDSGWPDAQYLYPSYMPPWTDFEARGVPMLLESESILPERTISYSRGRCGADYNKFPNICELFCSEKRQWREISSWAIIATGEGHFQSLVLDMGREVTGAVIVETDDTIGGEIIDIIGTEVVSRDGAPKLLPPDQYPDGIGMGSRLILRPRANCT